MKLLTSISVALRAVDLFQSYVAASPLERRWKKRPYATGLRAVNWQFLGHTETLSYDFCDGWLIEEVDGEPIIFCDPEARIEWPYPVTTYITRVKDIRSEGCTAGWTMEVLGEGDEAESSWLSLLPLCNDWGTSEFTNKERGDSHPKGAPETTLVGVKVQKLFRHPECLAWDVEEIETQTFRPKCLQWKFHIGGEYGYEHRFYYEEVVLSGRGCRDWRVDVDKRQTGRIHDQTIAMPFCDDPGSVNSIFLKDGKSDIAFHALSEDAAMSSQPMGNDA